MAESSADNTPYLSSRDDNPSTVRNRAKDLERSTNREDPAKKLAEAASPLWRRRLLRFGPDGTLQDVAV
jgi:hypothetical protein